jgi:broad specificity phosphatase PhoE
MTNDLLLVRHATCEHMDKILLGRTVDSSLDARGLQQAAALARSIEPQEELLVVASPRRRAQQTAEAIAAETQAEIITSMDIDEVDFGHWSGCTFEQLAEDPSWRRWNEQRSVTATPAGERIADVKARVLRHLQRLRDAFPGRPIALVTHAEVIRAVVLHWLDAPIDGYHRLAISPASLTRVSIGDWGVRIDGINQRSKESRT